MALGNLPSLTVSQPVVQRVLAGWPMHSYRQVRNLLARYGPPHQVSSAAMVWNYNDPWDKTIVWRSGSRHTFLTPHYDVVDQRIAYKVPADKLGELAAYNSSIQVDDVGGEISVCCATEADNFLVMNLAHEIMLGVITGEEAKQKQVDILNGKRLHWPEALMEALQFTVARSGYGVDESAERQRSPV